jgi:hypothetical protein
VPSISRTVSVEGKRFPKFKASHFIELDPNHFSNWLLTFYISLISGYAEFFTFDNYPAPALPVERKFFVGLTFGSDFVN